MTSKTKTRVTPYVDEEPAYRAVATVPPGVYLVGDPCYSVPDDLWMEWLEEADYTNGDRRHVLAAKIDGHEVVGVSTAHGDGVYYDGEGREYGVDAGLLGLVPVEVAKEEPDMDLPLLTLTEPADCYYDDGIVHLGPIEINTNWRKERP